MNPKKLYQWVQQSSKEWTGTTRHFKQSVVVFSRGVVLAKSSQLRPIAGCVGGKAASQRRRLQRFVGREQPLETFFGGWTRSVLRQVHPSEVVLVVDEAGMPQWPLLRSSCGVPGFDVAVMEAARQWTFSPATRAGRPVMGSYELRATFELGS